MAQVARRRRPELLRHLAEPKGLAPATLRWPYVPARLAATASRP